MKILVTGATGFIGKNLATRLASLGYDIICCGRNLHKLDSLASNIKKVHLELEDKDKLVNLLKAEKPGVVYHTAALVRSNSLKRLREVNVNGTKNVFEACIASGVDTVIYTSSIAVISHNAEIPLTDDLPYKTGNSYGQSKIEAEHLAFEYRKKGLKIAIIRPCMVYGENEPHGFGLLTWLLQNRLLPIFGNGENKLHLVSVDNVVDVMVLCLTKKEAYEGTYIVADKEALSIREVFTYIAKVLGVKPPFTIPENLTKILLKLPHIGGHISQFRKDRLYSVERLEEKFGYIPRVSVYDGLKRTVLSYKR